MKEDEVVRTIEKEKEELREILERDRIRKELDELEELVEEVTKRVLKKKGSHKSDFISVDLLKDTNRTQVSLSGEELLEGKREFKIYYSKIRGFRYRPKYCKQWRKIQDFERFSMALLKVWKEKNPFLTNALKKLIEIHKEYNELTSSVRPINYFSVRYEIDGQEEFMVGGKNTARFLKVKYDGRYGKAIEIEIYCDEDNRFRRPFHSIDSIYPEDAYIYHQLKGNIRKALEKFKRVEQKKIDRIKGLKEKIYKKLGKHIVVEEL